MGPNNQSPLSSLQDLLGYARITQPRSTQTQNKHDTLIRNQVSEYEQRAYRDIKADHIGHINGAPALVHGHIPDLTATDQSSRQVFCEVETGDTIDSSHTKEQLHAFRRAANDVGGFLHVVVPSEFLVYSQQVVGGWGIPVDFWWHG